MLELSRITKRFGSVVALDDVTVRFQSGTIHALLGENGAGKTTLMRIAYGMTRPDEGRVRLDGRTLNLRRPADAKRAGIGMIHQHFTLVESMTVAENILLGERYKGFWLPRGALGRRALDVARRIGFDIHP